jgi:hypothetical protein
MLPSFVKMARKYNIPNPEDWAEEWQTKAYLISLKFDDGSLKKKGFIEGENGLSEEADETAFLKSFRGYLIEAFKNDLNLHFAKGKKFKTVSAVDENGEAHSALPSTKASIMTTDTVYIEDILAVINKDIRRSKSNAETPSEACTLAFEKSAATALSSMNEVWKDIPVLLDANLPFDSRSLAVDFLPEWRDRTKFALAHELLSESCPLTIQKLGAILFSKQDHALVKRFERYLTEKMGGMSARIKRLKNDKNV